MAKSVIKDLINMDYNTLIQLTKKENIDSLKSVVYQMSKVANRRISELNKTEIGKYSPALKSLHDSGINKFELKAIESYTSADTGKLLHQYSKLKKFLQAKSSTVSGWNKIRADIKNRTGANKLFAKEFKSSRSAKIWVNREKRFWKLYNELVDNYGGIITQLDSDRIQAMLSKVQTTRKNRKNRTDDEISEIMNKYVDDLYKASEKGKKLNDKQWSEEYIIQFGR